MQYARLIGRFSGSVCRPFLRGSERKRRAQATDISDSVADFCVRHTPLAIALGVNFLLVFGLGGVVIVSKTLAEPPDFFAPNGFVQEEEKGLPPPPTGGGSSGVDASPAAIAALMPTDSVPILAIQTTAITPSSITFSAPGLPSIDPVSAAAVAGLTTKTEVSETPGAGRSEGQTEGNGTAKSAEVGGMTMVAERLGIIMEYSAVTTPLLPKVVGQIKKQFPGAVRANVWECQLIKTKAGTFSAAVEAAKTQSRHGGIDSGLRTDPDTIAAILRMVEADKVDAIFWFTDMMHMEDARLLGELKAYLIEKKVRFYLRAWRSGQVQPALAEIIAETGGDHTDSLRESNPEAFR